jgi:hypothetical protein
MKIVAILEKLTVFSQAAANVELTASTRGLYSLRVGSRTGFMRDPVIAVPPKSCLPDAPKWRPMLCQATFLASRVVPLSELLAEWGWTGTSDPRIFADQA